jgi:glycosyltransferase involved in cell wall biosynthesis
MGTGDAGAVVDPDRIVCVSRSDRDAGVAAGLFGADRAAVVENGIDLDRFRSAGPGDRRRIRAELGVGPDEFLAGCIGRWSPEKGHATVLEAAARLSGGSASAIG